MYRPWKENEVEVDGWVGVWVDGWVGGRWVWSVACSAPTPPASAPLLVFLKLVERFD